MPRPKSRRAPAFSREQLAKALGLALIHCGDGMPVAVCGTAVADVDDGLRGMAFAMLMRADLTRDRRAVEALAASLRTLVSDK